MKIDSLVVGIIVICFAKLLLADAMLTTYNPAKQVLSPNDVKDITGVVFGVTAVLIFIEAFVKTKQ